jgi:hypothetical protein
MIYLSAHRRSSPGTDRHVYLRWPIGTYFSNRTSGEHTIPIRAQSTDADLAILDTCKNTETKTKTEDQPPLRPDHPHGCCRNLPRHVITIDLPKPPVNQSSSVVDMISPSSHIHQHPSSKSESNVQQIQRIHIIDPNKKNAMSRNSQLVDDPRYERFDYLISMINLLSFHFIPAPPIDLSTRVFSL